MTLSDVDMILLAAIGFLVWRNYMLQSKLDAYTYFLLALGRGQGRLVRTDDGDGFRFESKGNV